MLFVAASDLSPSDLALMDNNIRPPRRPVRTTPHQRENRRVTNLTEFFQRFQSLNVRSNAELDRLVEGRSVGRDSGEEGRS